MPQSILRRLLDFVGILLCVVVVGAVVWLLLGGPMLTQISSFQSFDLAAMPTTPLSQLKSHAGTGELVRVRATMLGIPAVTDEAGDPLAFKFVTQIQKRSRDGDYIRDREWIPGHFRIGDGNLQVAVELKERAPSDLYLPQRASGYITGDKQIPADVAPILAPNFADLRPVRFNEITVFTINRGAPVTIFGVVEIENGEPVIYAMPHRYAGVDAGRLLLSSYSETELNHQLKRTGYFAFVLLAILLLPVVFVSGLFIWSWRKNRQDARAKADALKAS